MAADAHETDRTAANPRLFSAPRPGTSIALPHTPCRSLTTNAWSLPKPSPYSPPAAQLPADGHDTENVPAAPPLFRAPRPGTSIALLQTPAVTAPAAADLTPAAATPVIVSGTHHTAAAPATTIMTRCFIGPPSRARLSAQGQPFLFSGKLQPHANRPATARSIAPPPGLRLAARASEPVSQLAPACCDAHPWLQPRPNNGRLAVTDSTPQSWSGSSRSGEVRGRCSVTSYYT